MAKLSTECRFPQRNDRRDKRGASKKITTGRTPGEIRMNKKQVIEKIGEENWDKFQKFMKGQTVGFDKGVIDYYEDDVDNFCFYCVKCTEDVGGKD